jgi:hypothetical protein
LDSQEFNEKYPHAALGDTDMQNMLNLKTHTMEIKYLKNWLFKDKLFSKQVSM